MPLRWAVKLNKSLQSIHVDLEVNYLQHLHEATGDFLALVVLIEKLSQETAPSSTLPHSAENLQCLFSFPLEIRASACWDSLQIVFKCRNAAREISSNQMQRVPGCRFWESSKKELWACSPGCMECVYMKCTAVVWSTLSKVGISRSVLGAHIWFSFMGKLECDCTLFVPESCLIGSQDRQELLMALAILAMSQDFGSTLGAKEVHTDTYIHKLFWLNWGWDFC